LKRSKQNDFRSVFEKEDEIINVVDNDIGVSKSNDKAANPDI
jgi:hypothetical protein